MVTPPANRLELVLMADQTAPVRLWAQTSAANARRFEYDKAKSLQILAGAGAIFLLMTYFLPAATIILLLIAVIVLFPTTLVGMTGFSRGV